MTDPADHTTRLRAIEARLEREAEVHVRYTDDPPSHVSDLRYLLDRVRSQSERNEALEAAMRRTWSKRNDAGAFYCGVCGNMADFTAENIHDPTCVVRSLPAPETVETQG